jgi:hypothetical protein
MIRGLSIGRNPIDLLIERESIFNILSTTTSDHMFKTFETYSLDPATR